MLVMEVIEEIAGDVTMKILTVSGVVTVGSYKPQASEKTDAKMAPYPATPYSTIHSKEGKF
jgi:hypothetical protein